MTREFREDVSCDIVLDEGNVPMTVPDRERVGGVAGAREFGAASIDGVAEREAFTE